MSRLRLAVPVLGAFVASLVTTDAMAATLSVNCTQNQSALATALSVAIAGDTLQVTGTCLGTYDITKSVTIAGPAVLDGNGSGPVVTIEPLASVLIRDVVVRGGVSTGA